MIKRPDLYSQSYTTTSSLYSKDLVATRGEIDLRAEFDEIVYGHQSGIRHSHPIIIRKASVDSNNKTIECTCKNTITREPDPDCSYCFGEGFISKEFWHLTYSMYSSTDTGLAGRLRFAPPGQVRVDYRIFFFRYDTKISYKDKIVEVCLDTEGRVIQPLTYKAVYKPSTIYEYRSDNGRIEYIAVYCREDEAIREEKP